MPTLRYAKNMKNALLRLFSIKGFLLVLMILLATPMVAPFASDQNSVGGTWVWVKNTIFGARGEAVVGTGSDLYIASKSSFYRYRPADDSWTQMAAPPNPDSGDVFKTGTALAWDGGDYIYALCGAEFYESRRWFYRYSISGNHWEALQNTPANQGEGDTIALVAVDDYLYDDDETFWSKRTIGSGSYDVTISEETTEKQVGTSSVKMVIGAGSYEGAGIEHTYSPAQDFTVYGDYLQYWIYGANTGLTIELQLATSGGWGKYNTVDNFTGWRLITKIVSDPDIYGGSFDPSAVTQITIWYRNINTSFTSYLDRTSLHFAKLYATIGSGDSSTRFVCYDPSTDTWSGDDGAALTGPPLSMVDGASMVWTGGDSLYVLRGKDYDFWRYDLTNDSWTSISDIPAHPQGGGGGGVGEGASLLYAGLWLSSQADFVYALGGDDDNRFFRYTISTDSWERLEDLPFSVGYYIGCRLGYADGHIYAWQGSPSSWAGGGDDLARYEFHDLTSPTTTISLSGVSGEEGWFTSDVTVTLSATDDQSGVNTTEVSFDNINWNTYAEPFTVVDEGSTIVYYRSVDGKGNEEKPNTETIRIDETAPSGIIAISDDAKYTTSTSVTITLSAEDVTSGVAQARFSHDTVTWTPWEAYSPSRSWELTAGDGTKTVFVQFMDGAGLISPTYQDAISLDASKPVPNAGVDQDVDVNTVVDFDGSGSRDNAAVVSYEWDFGDGTTETGVTATHVYRRKGTYTVTLRVEDAAGNVAADTMTVTVEEIEIAADDSTYAIPIETNSTVSDLVFDQTTLQINLTISGPAGTVGTFKITIPKELVPEGHGFEVNVDGEPCPFTLTENNTCYFISLTHPHSLHQVTIGFIDVTYPTAEAGPDQTVRVNSKVTFDAGGSSDNVGVVGYEWDFGDGTTETGVTATHTYTEPGTYVVTLTGMDAAGNLAMDTLTVIVRSPMAWQLLGVAFIACLGMGMTVFLVWITKLR